jgi:hypothetical protein
MSISRVLVVLLAAGSLAAPSALADDEPVYSGQPNINLCEWEPTSCNGSDPQPPRCLPTSHGSKICLVDPPVVPIPPPCSVDAETGETSCPEPPVVNICMTSRFASEEAAIEAGCLPPKCEYADTSSGEAPCLTPPPCIVDEQGNQVCAVYDLAPMPKTGKPTKPAKKKPAKKKPAAKKPAAKKPAAKKPAAKKPAAKKPILLPAPARGSDGKAPGGGTSGVVFR